MTNVCIVATIVVYLAAMLARGRDSSEFVIVS